MEKQPNSQGTRHDSDHVAIYVIGEAGALRSTSLAKALEDSPFPVTVVEPYRPQVGVVSQLVDQSAAMCVFGRMLTPGEVGCWFAHRVVYEAAEGQGTEWNIVLEDDAGVPPEFWPFLKTWLPSLDTGKPIIVSLFAQDYPRGRTVVAKGDATLLALPYAPTNTVAYVINRKAVDVALRAPRRAMSTADWPPWSTEVNFLLLANSPILHEGVSTIGHRPDPSSRWRPFARLLVVLTPHSWSLGRPYCRGFRTYLEWSLIVPARKALRRASKQSRHLRTR